MKYFKLIYLSVFFGIVSILAFFNITYSYYLNLYLNLNTYIITFVVSILLTILFYYSKNNDEKKITIYDKILTILLGYFLCNKIILLKKLILWMYICKYLNLGKGLDSKNR